MVDLDRITYIVMLEQDIISYQDFVSFIADIPKEYATYTLFLKNKGKASKRIAKEMEWRTNMMNTLD